MDMAIIKCKMCGGDLALEEGSNVAECEYCGSRQTVPSADNEKKLNLFARANRLRANNEFDKAAGIYESIVADFPEEAEAYWGLILCKYGIEYVDDPATGKKIPTCHRSSFDSVMDDPNFELVMENADPIARRVYREEAKQLEELRKGIIEVSSKEDPYDIFICYKETTEDGQRTLDSVLAQDVYDMLTENGYRVFFSRVTLEDKLGVEYEPYIFAALNSAKIMLAFGTDYDYYNAVWVKNEWSRFLQLIAKGEKKVLIPCFKNLDVYDIPKEFAKLQAQDMGKVGAMQDLLRGIKKILPKAQTGAYIQSQEFIRSESDSSLSPLLSRGNQLLQAENWEAAKDYFDRVLDADAMNGEAYFGLVLVENRKKSLDELVAALAILKDEKRFVKITVAPKAAEQIDKLASDLSVESYLSAEKIKGLFQRDGYYYESREASAKENQRKALEQMKYNRNFFRAKKYARSELKELLCKAEKTIDDLFSADLQHAKEEAKKARTEAEERLQVHYVQTKQLYHKACDERDKDYEHACSCMQNGAWDSAITFFRKMTSYKDSTERLQKCIAGEEAAEIRAQTELERRDLLIQIEDLTSRVRNAERISEVCDQYNKMKVWMVVCYTAFVLIALVYKESSVLLTLAGITLIAGVVATIMWKKQKKDFVGLLGIPKAELDAQKIAALNKEAKKQLEIGSPELAQLESRLKELDGRTDEPVSFHSGKQTVNPTEANK